MFVYLDLIYWMSSKTRLLTVVVIALALVGSTMALGAAQMGSPMQASNTQTQDSSFLRVAHASPDAPAVDVMVDNETVYSNVSFANVSDYVQVQAGTHNVTIAASDDPETVVFEDEVALEARTVTTVAASGEITENASTSFEPIMFDDDALEPKSNESAIRIVHLSPDAPTVDVTADNGSVVLAENVSYQESSDYMTVPAGNYTAEIRAATATNDGDIVTTADVSLENETAYSAMAVGYLNSDDTPADTPFQVVASEDATKSLNIPSEAESPSIRVVHLSPDAPAVDVTADNGSVVIADNVSFQNGSDYMTVPAGNYTVEIRPATETNDGEVVTTVDVSLENETTYSAVATGYLDPENETVQEPFEVVLLEDT